MLYVVLGIALIALGVIIYAMRRSAKEADTQRESRVRTTHGRDLEEVPFTKADPIKVIDKRTSDVPPRNPSPADLHSAHEIRSQRPPVRSTRPTNPTTSGVKKRPVVREMEDMERDRRRREREREAREADDVTYVDPNVVMGMPIHENTASEAPSAPSEPSRPESTPAPASERYDSGGGFEGGGATYSSSSDSGSSGGGYSSSSDSGSSSSSSGSDSGGGGGGE